MMQRLKRKHFEVEEEEAKEAPAAAAAGDAVDGQTTGKQAAADAAGSEQPNKEDKQNTMDGKTEEVLLNECKAAMAYINAKEAADRHFRERNRQNHDGRDSAGEEACEDNAQTDVEGDLLVDSLPESSETNLEEAAATSIGQVDDHEDCANGDAAAGPPGDDDSEAPTSDTSSSHWVNDCPECKIVFDPCTTCCRVIRMRRSTLEYLRQCMRASLVGLHMPPPPPHPL